MNGRRAQQQPATTVQARLVPLAPGHASEAVPARQSEPFGTDAPEATFSITQARDAAPAPADTVVTPLVQLQASVPDQRGMRVARAAAATRGPVAEVRIPIAEMEGSRLPGARAVSQPVLPGMEQLVERVRQRTAARLARSGAASPA